MSDLSATDIAIQNRKFAKTCVEKKRRDRINKCLDQLKELMSQADDKARYQKMEKAEILEMAVSYMKNLTRNDSSGNKNQKSELEYYSLAYRQCLSEFQNLLYALPGLNDELKSNVMNQMSQRYIEMLSYTNNSKSNNSQNEEPSSSSQGGKIKMNSNKSNRFSPYASSSKLTPSKSKKQHNNEDNMMSIMTNEQNMSTSSNSSALSPSLQNQTSKFGGSCSSLDSYNGNARATSPCGSSNSSNNDHNESHTTSSPALSVCSSPINSNSNTSPNLNSSLVSAAAKSLYNMRSDLSSTLTIEEQQQLAAINFANFSFYQNCLMKVWRPW